jgi:hypothetical protein
VAYIPNYKHDIFVSYAHVDDLPLVPGVEEGWVTTLVKCLKPRLAQELGRSEAYSLWMDNELSGHEKVTPQILDALRGTALILIVLSPGYLASEWCKREKDAFLDLIKERRGSCVFIIERNKIEDRDRPPEFNDLKGFKFWRVGQEGKSTHVLGTPVLAKELTPEVREYYGIVDGLIKELVDELHQMKAAAKLPATSGNQIRDMSPESLSPGQPTVYLAQVTDDLESERNNVKRYLTQAQVNVLPATWYSQEPNSFRQSVGRDLAKCSLFVQLLSGVSGKKPPDLPQGYLKLQLELAKETHKPILQWRSPAFDVTSVEDADHRKLIEGESVRAEGIEDFKREIRRRLLEKPEMKQPISAFVFVNMETSDRPLAEQVCSVLDRSGVGYSMPMQSEDPAKNRRDLEQNLLDCTGIIIIYGCSTVDWVRQQLLESRKILIRRESPIQAFAVFEGPPEQKCSLDLKFANMQILNSRRGFSETELEKFLDLIRKRGA